MLRSRSWKLLMSLFAVLIVIGSFFYSDMLSRKLSEQERKKVEEWVTAEQRIASASADEDLSLPMIVVTDQQSIPVIETDEKDNIMSFINLDTVRAKTDPRYLEEQLSDFKQRGAYITTYFGEDERKFNRYYYGESNLLKQIRYFPLLQMFVVLLFAAVMLYAIRNEHRSSQNRLWAGLAKETAHQLGTPISALSGWTEILKEGADLSQVLGEMVKDIDRLKLISERFTVIGGVPRKEDQNLVSLVTHAVDYIKKRASEKTAIVLHLPEKSIITVKVSALLIEWVIENILKNALDATEGEGRVDIYLYEEKGQVMLDIADTGKGITSAIRNEIFQPGFTTKKRGWGLGLTLSRRIVEEYHGGELTVKSSESGKGTTFRMVLKK